MTKHCGWANETSPARIHPCAMVCVSSVTIGYSRPLRCLHGRIRQLAVLNHSGFHPQTTVLVEAVWTVDRYLLLLPICLSTGTSDQGQDQKLNIIHDETDDDGWKDGSGENIWNIVMSGCGLG